MVIIKVLMIITGFVMGPDGLEQTWEFDRVTSPYVCMTMSTLVSGAGKAGAIIVKCNSIEK